MKSLTILFIVVSMIAAAAAAGMFEGQGRKIEFDNSYDMASQNLVYDDDDEDEDEDMFADVTMDDLEDLRWMGVTRDEYEYEGTLAEVEGMLSQSDSDQDEDESGSECDIDEDVGDEDEDVGYDEDDEDEDGEYFGEHGDDTIPYTVHNRSRRRIY